MSNNQKLWGLISILVLVTLSLTFGTIPSQTQQTARPKPTPNRPDISAYPVAELNASAPGNSAEGRARARKNKRYDKYPIIKFGLSPRHTAVAVYDSEPDPPHLPVAESRLIVVGTILDSKAFVSSNREGLYSEYSLQIESIIKNDSASEKHVGETICIDRSGGNLRYPSGQKVMYFVAGQSLPLVGSRYVFFLKKDGDEDNPNYKIVTGYELKDGLVNPLDTNQLAREYTGLEENVFLSKIKAIN